MSETTSTPPTSHATAGDFHGVLVGTHPHADGTERLLAAEHVDGLLHLLIELDRSSNTSLLDADVWYVHDGRRTRRWRVSEMHVLDATERGRLWRGDSPLGERLALVILRRAPIPPIGCLEL